MVDRTIIFGENNRSSQRGIRQTSEARFEVYHRDDDVLPYVWDFANWLGTDTISSVVRETSGTAVTTTSNTTTTMTQSLSGAGYVDFKIVSAAAKTKQFRVVVRQRSEDSDAVNDMYPWN
jgi:hypothetical protein